MEETSVKPLENGQDCIDAVREVVESAEDNIAIFSQNLEPLLYNHLDLCERFSILARKHRNSGIRIIVQNTRSAVADGHCLVHLAQKLSSYVQIRTPTTPELQRFEQSWIIADRHSICEISNPQRWEGQLILHNRLHVKTQLEFFDHAWENSEPDIHTRRLSI